MSSDPQLLSFIISFQFEQSKVCSRVNRRCANNLTQVAIHANSYGVYPTEISALQKDYTELWGRVSEVLKQLTTIVKQ